MIACRIKNKGAFMTGLLSQDTFDSFLLQEAVIGMAATMTLDGHLNRDFFPKDVWEDRQERPYEYVPWSEMRGVCRNFIKGSRAPSSFRFILLLKPEYVDATLAEAPEETKNAVDALAVTIRLSESGITLVTGIAMKTFVPDKSAEKIWDRTMQHFLSAKGIDYDVQ